MKQLTYETLREQGYQGYLLQNAPERVLQFGEGNFLRAFVEDFIDQMNETAGFDAKVVLVQPRGGHPESADLYTAQEGLYTLILRGRENGQPVERKRVISCASRCLDPKRDWSILPIQVVDNVTPYKQRKVRILNGAHTSMVLGAYLAGKQIVRECMEDDVIRGFLNKTLFDEIIPTLDLPKDELTEFAGSVIDRFNNPYIDHRLTDIALNSTAKWKARVMPSLIEYVKREGRLPKCITFSFAAYAAFYRKGGEAVRDDEWVLDFYREHANDDAKAFAHAVVNNERMWDGELARLPGFEAAVAADLERIDAVGMYEAFRACL